MIRFYLKVLSICLTYNNNNNPFSCYFIFGESVAKGHLVTKVVTRVSNVVDELLENFL